MPDYFLIMPNTATIITVTVLLLVVGPVFSSTLYAQLSLPAVEQWIDKERGIKILFSHSPEKLIANSPTTFEFSVQNLTSGRRINDVLVSVVIINDFQKASQFLNIPVSNGEFLLKYSFPYNGHNQIILHIKRNSFGLALASFDVSVSAPIPSANLLFQAILLGVGFPSAVMVVLLTMLKKKRGNFIF